MNPNTSRAPGSTDPATGGLAPAGFSAAPLGAAQVSFPRALRAEWLKLMSLRLNWWLGLAALAVMALTLLAAVFSARSLFSDPPPDLDAQLAGLSLFENTFFSLTLVTLLMGALAAVAITTEHTSGSIRSSLAAVPNRTMFFTAKLLAVCGFIAALTGALLVLSFLVLLPLAGFYDVMPDLREPDLWWMALSNAAVVVITASLGFGLGALLRSTAGAVVTYCLVLFGGPIGLALLQALTDYAQWVEELARFEIFALQRQFTSGSAVLSTDLPVPMAGALLLVWAGVVLIPGWLLFIRRDA